MSDGSLHRILSGSPERRAELVAAGIFVAVWFAMDFVQWIDWFASKVAPAPVVCTVGLDLDKAAPVLAKELRKESAK